MDVRRVPSFVFLGTVLRGAAACCRSVYAAVTSSAEFLAAVKFGDARGAVVFTFVILIALSADLKPLLVLTVALSCASEMAQDAFLLVVVVGAADDDKTWWR